jgi:hypothetical protein
MFGPRLGIGADQIAPQGLVGLVTRDASSLIYCPATAAEWTATMAAAGLSAIGNPTQLWKLQEASGSPADSIGSATLTANGAVSYQQTVSGWTRKAIVPTSGGANYLFNNSDGALSDGSTVPVTLLMYVAITSTPGADVDVALIGDSNGPKAIVTSANKPKLMINASVTATGGSALGTGVRPWVISTPGGVAPAYNNLYDDLEVVAPASTNCSSALKQVFFGGVVEAAPSMQMLYAAQWAGTGKSMTTAQTRTLLSTLGWSPAF